jgi:cyanate permease
VLCAAFLLLVKENPDGDQTGESASIHGFSVLLRNRNLVQLFILAFLGLGFFNGLTTWLEPILAPQGIGSVQAGTIGGVLILGGIIGAALIPTLSDFLKRRRPFIIGSILAALLTLYPLCHLRTYSWVLAFGALQGFFFLPAFALLLEACSEIAGKARAGSATGILMLTGNAGGVVVILAMDAVRGASASFSRSVSLMEAILLAALFISFFIPETFHRRG